MKILYLTTLLIGMTLLGQPFPTSCKIAGREYAIVTSSGAHYFYQTHFCLHPERKLGFWWDATKQETKVIRFADNCVVATYPTPHPMRAFSLDSQYAIIGEPPNQYFVWNIEQQKAMPLDLQASEIPAWQIISDNQAISTVVSAGGKIALVDLATAQISWIEIKYNQQPCPFLILHGLVSPDHQSVLYGAEGWNGEKTIHGIFQLDIAARSLSTLSWDIQHPLIPFSWGEQPGTFYAEHNGLSRIQICSTKAFHQTPPDNSSVQTTHIKIVANNPDLQRILCASLAPSEKLLYVATGLHGLYCLDPVTLEIKQHYPKIGRNINAYSLGVLFCGSYALVTTPYAAKLAILDSTNAKLIQEVKIAPSCAAFLLESKTTDTMPSCVILPVELPYE